MAYLTTAVAIVGVLCLLDLVLTYGVIRRLREHARQLASAPPARRPAQARPLPEPGTVIGRFATTSATGEPLTSDLFDDETLVGFFSPDCGPCKKLLPDFLIRAAQGPGGRSRALAVVVGDPEAATPLVAALEPVAQVVIEAGTGGMVSAAFDVTSYPSVFTVDGNRTVTASGRAMAALRRPARPVAAAVGPAAR